MKLAFILGDQLSHSLPSLATLDPASDAIWMAEVRAEATAVRHHKKKIAFIFSAMRHFAAELQARGFRVHYTRINDPHNAGSFRDEAQRALQEIQPTSLLLTAPSEYRVLTEVQSWQDAFQIPVQILPDDRFLASHNDFAQWAAGRKQFRMEFFYREMRRRYNTPKAVNGTTTTTTAKLRPRGPSFPNPRATHPTPSPPKP